MPAKLRNTTAGLVMRIKRAVTSSNSGSKPPDITRATRGANSISSNAAALITNVARLSMMLATCHNSSRSRSANSEKTGINALLTIPSINRSNSMRGTRAATSKAETSPVAPNR
jgi:hypothetical protein